MHRVHTETLTRQEKRQLWDEIVADYLTSGEKMKPYSAANGIIYDHLNYYVRMHKRKNHPEASFIPLKMLATPTQSIRIEYDKLTLILPPSFNHNDLVTLVKQLSC